MKKFISMVMAAAMVVSMVPATAFAADATVEGKVVGDVTMSKDEAAKYCIGDTAYVGPVATNVEMQLAFATMDANAQTTGEAFDVTLYVDNAEAVDGSLLANASVGYVTRQSENLAGTPVGTVTVAEDVASGEDEIKVTIKEDPAYNFRKGDIIVINLNQLNLGLTTKSVGTEVTIALGGDLETEEMTVVAIEKAFLDINVEGANKEVAEGDNVVLRPVVIKAKPDGQAFAGSETVELRVKGGFELIENTNTKVETFSATGAQLADATLRVDEDEATITSIPAGTKTLKIVNLELEAVDAKAGDIAVLEAKCDGYKSDSDEAAVVIGGGVVMSVDDVDVPVMYSGATLKEAGLTSKNDHESLEVTIEETSVDAWNTNKAWSLTLPEGVYVVDTNAANAAVDGGVNVNKTDNMKDYKAGDVDAMFEKAYEEGDFEAFLFPTKSFKVTDDKKAKLSFTLDLVADPNFEGDVVLTLEGDDIEAQEVVIATFVRHTVVEGYANDVIIDYKETEIPTDVTITEAETGLWKENQEFHVGVEFIAVEEIASVEVDDASDMEIKKLSDGFKVTEKSGDEPAVVTINGMKLYMERNIPAGSYDLMLASDIVDAYMMEVLYGTDDDTTPVSIYEVSNWFDDFGNTWGLTEAYGAELEGFVNVITAGRDQDDATFTTEVVVTIGNTEFFVGGAAYTMDVPAYINADGRTMMPIRAVATALGINDDCVRWDGETKTITILYGQRTITMKAGDRMIYINAAVMPATTAVEIVNGRAFLPLRDLAAALGVTDVEWDGATQTATLNGSY